MQKILPWLAIFIALVALVQNPLKSVFAAITNSSRVISYQGRLTDSSDNNVADGTYSLTFKIYTVSTGGSPSFTESHSTITISSGLFSVLLGSLSANGVNLDFANPPYYLGITVGANSEMTPRIQLGFVPLAHNAQYLDGNPASAFGVPSGIIAYSATTCPTGWSEYTAARGLYVVGNPSGGTLATAVGTALTNLENRAVGQHNHGVTDPGHSHSLGATGDTGASGQGNVILGGGSNGGRSTSGASTGITINNSGSVAGTNAPYIQLTACKKD